MLCKRISTRLRGGAQALPRKQQLPAAAPISATSGQWSAVRAGKVRMIGPGCCARFVDRDGAATAVRTRALGLADSDC